MGIVKLQFLHSFWPGGRAERRSTRDVQCPVSGGYTRAVIGQSTVVKVPAHLKEMFKFKLG